MQCLYFIRLTGDDGVRKTLAGVSRRVCVLQEILEMTRQKSETFAVPTGMEHPIAVVIST
jgi:hypothetical protein